MTDAQGYYSYSGQASGNGSYTQNIYNRKAEWGPTFFDNKYNGTGSFVYGLPFGRRHVSERTGFVRSIWLLAAGNWEASTPRILVSR